MVRQFGFLKEVISQLSRLKISMASTEELRVWVGRGEELARKAGALFVQARAHGSFDTISKGGVVS
jgi:hypothetical protein